MSEREVQDDNKVIWRCVRVFNGSNGEAATAAAEKSENNGEVEVVCTPSGGEKTVRLKLQTNWEESLSDKDLITSINFAKEKSP
jgi:hypothetical protein